MRSRADIGIDLGNSKFSLYARGEGVVASEASYIAYAGDRLTERSVVAVGDAARAMFERVPKGLHVLCPMRAGIIVDCRAAGMILRTLARRGGLTSGWSKPKALVAALYGSSSVERKAFLDVAATVGGGRPTAVHEPLAAANAVGLDIGGPGANMLVDVGDGATEAIIVSAGQTLAGSSMRFGGFDVETRLMEHVRKRFDLIISRTQARRLKERFHRLSGLGAAPEAGLATVAVKGINVHGYIPCEMRLPLAAFQPMLAAVADVIADFVLKVLAEAPATAAVDLIDNGIYLCGGASRMAGVKERLEAQTRLPINLVDSPEHAVAQGLGRMLDFSAYC